MPNLRSKKRQAGYVSAPGRSGGGGEKGLDCEVKRKGGYVRKKEGGRFLALMSGEGGALMRRQKEGGGRSDPKKGKKKGELDTRLAERKGVFHEEHSSLGLWSSKEKREKRWKDQKGKFF